MSEHSYPPPPQAQQSCVIQADVDGKNRFPITSKGFRYPKSRVKSKYRDETLEKRKNLFLRAHEVVVFQTCRYWCMLGKCDGNTFFALACHVAQQH